jgi:PEP-CTERM motif
MKKTWRKFAGSALAAAVLGLVCVSAQAVSNAPPQPVPVDVPPYEYLAAPPLSYQFSGNCVDCAAAAHTSTYSVTGTLVLKGSLYMDGQTLGNADFQSFSYAGSNLFAAFTMDASKLRDFSATFGPHLSFVDILGTDGKFFHTAGIDWNTGLDQCSPKNSVICVMDYGNSAQWSAVSSVPEPESYALMLAGLVLMGQLARSRRSAHMAQTQACAA